MGSTAIQIATEAFRSHNLNEITSFSITQEFPYKIARDIINDVLRVMNRMGSYWFTETKTALVYAPGTYTYSMVTLAIDPKRVIKLRKEAANFWGDMIQKNYQSFQKTYRNSTIQTAQPNVWSKFNDTIELACIPDQDYSIYVYHYKQMPKITLTTDTFMFPVDYEDVLIDSVYQMLKYKTGSIGYTEAIQAIQVRMSPFLVDMQSDAGMPNQFPASF